MNFIVSTNTLILQAKPAISFGNFRKQNKKLDSAPKGPRSLANANQ